MEEVFKQKSVTIINNKIRYYNNVIMSITENMLIKRLIN